MADVGKKTIDSNFSSPSSKGEVLPPFNGELRYTFATTSTQLFVGNLLEDHLRFDLATQEGWKVEDRVAEKLLKK